MSINILCRSLVFSERCVRLFAVNLEDWDQHEKVGCQKLGFLFNIPSTIVTRIRHLVVLTLVVDECIHI